MRHLGLAPRLFVATCLVIVAGAGTLLAVALAFAPAVFYAHLQQSRLPAVTGDVRTHVDEAFTTALAVSLAVGVLVASVVALAVTWLVARRLAGPVQDVVAATQRLADGHYDTVVDDPGLGPEFAGLADAVTRLAHRLARAEDTRRRVTADLAHQLRTPVASLEATIEAVTDGVLAPDAATLAVLADQAARLHRLVADVERASRAEERQHSLERGVHPVTPLVQRCLDSVRERFRLKGVALTLDDTASGSRVQVDADRVAEAVTNLLDNALRHTPEGGSVIVRVADVVSSDGPEPAGGVRITVQDNGSGFVPAEGEELFRRFRRGSGADPATGSGLGLTIARALVEAHGGTVTGQSAGPGTGATFTVTLPAAAAR